MSWKDEKQLFGLHKVTQFAVLAFVFAAMATPVSAQTSVVVDDLGGFRVSLAEINGHPAMAYVRDQVLWYVRAAVSDGMAWGPPIQAYSLTGQIEGPSLALVGGHPAISFVNVSTEELLYLRADDQNGATWGTPVVLTMDYYYGTATSLGVVNGNPAVCVHHPVTGSLTYTRATDSVGTNWGSPVAISNGVGSSPSLSIVDGVPAYAFMELDWDTFEPFLWFVRASDADGSGWAVPVNVDAQNVIGSPSIDVVNGTPAIAYYSETSAELLYVRALSSDGTSWGNPIVVDSEGDVGEYASLATIGGMAAIAYYDATDGDLMFVRSLDAYGDTWDLPMIVDSDGDVGRWASLKSVNGSPGIGYSRSTNSALKYANPDGIFFDSFESGDTSAWSPAVP